MNLFVIPSWYPNSVQPISGIFVREQVEAIADLAPDVRVLVSTWGHDAATVSIRDVSGSIAAVRWRSSQPSKLMLERNGVCEVFNPTIWWSHRLLFGGARRLVEVNRRNLSQALRRFRNVDLIHAHVSYPAGYVAAVLSREFGIPYVLTEHMGPFPHPSLLRGGRPVWELNQAFKSAALIIAVSRFLARRITSYGYQEPVVIPNLVDERRFTVGAPCGGKFVFFTLCSLNDQKGIDHLLQAIALWNPPAARFEFRIGGDGPLRMVYEALAVRLGVADRVRWLGPVTRDKAPDFFRSCHVYVMPSLHETFGVVYAEAIACGKPVIATRCGGPEDIVNEKNGRLVDVGDVEGLAAQMAVMANDWGRYAPEDIRGDFLARFSRPAVVTQLVNVFKGVLEKG